MCFFKFLEFVKFTQSQIGKKLKAIRSDNAKEFYNRRMNDFCKARGIRHQLTVEYTPEKNGAAERGNRTVTEKSRKIIEDTIKSSCLSTPYFQSQ